jgi:hypothetical protein
VKGITMCADCAYYNMKTHKCTRGCMGEPDTENGDDVRFFTDCPLPNVAEVRRGRWIAVSSLDACGGDEEAWMAHGNPTAYHYCSECKNETYLNEEGKEILSDYCPFCGADLREEGADNGY